GDNTAMRVEGRISGPNPSYVYIFGIYDNDGAIAVRLIARQFNQGTTVSLQPDINFTNVHLANNTNGQLPVGTYRLFLFAMIPDASEAVIPDNIRNVPAHLRQIRPAERIINITPIAAGGAGPERERELAEQERQLMGLGDELIENYRRKHESINKFIERYNASRFDDAIKEIVNIKTIIKKDIEILEEQERKKNEIVHGLEEMRIIAEQNNEKENEKKIVKILSKLRYIVSVIDRLMGNLNMQKKVFDELGSSIDDKEMKIMRDVLPKLKEYVENEAEMLKIVNAKEKEIKDEIDRIHKKTLENIQKVRQEAESRAARVAPASARATPTPAVAKPKITVSEKANISGAVQLSISKKMISQYEIGLSKEDIESLGIQEINETHILTINHIVEGRGLTRSFKHNIDSEKGSLALGHIDLQLLELKEKDAVKCVLQEWIYSDGNKRKFLVLEKID
ncbi:MAG: hypothetical protein NT001_00625, partial [Candidatus Woesearchaeota archaeon]|nr:hypothetical protein [Candidatus Woesearchaeota archaeon]